MGEFMTWDILGTIVGATAATCLLTQFIKNIPIQKKIPTQIISYFIAAAVLISAKIATHGFQIDMLILCLINAIAVSFCSNGGYSIYIRTKHKYDGEIIIEEDDPEKDTYRLELNDINDLHTKNLIVFKVNKR